MADKTFGFIAVVFIILLAAFLIPPSALNFGNRNVSTYEETLELSISFPEETEFSILFPVILAESELSPAIANIGENNPKISYKILNDTRYLEVNDTSSIFGISNTVFLPDRQGSKIEYEEFLFSHEYELDQSGLVSIHLFANISATVTYKIDAVTNLCSFDSGSQVFNSLAVPPGKTSFFPSQISFVTQCA